MNAEVKKKFLTDLEAKLDYMPAQKLYTIFKKLAHGLKERIKLAQCEESLDVNNHFAPVIMKVIDFIKKSVKLPEPLPSEPNQLPKPGFSPDIPVFVKSRQTSLDLTEYNFYQHIHCESSVKKFIITGGDKEQSEFL